MRNIITTIALIFTLPLSAQTKTPTSNKATIATPTKTQTPLALTKSLQAALPIAYPSLVALNGPCGAGSGVIISPDGLILTASHMSIHFEPGQKALITLNDGTKATAIPLGKNVETDIALFKIITERDTPWPHAKLAKSSPTTGAFVFTLGHPSGRKKGRPALPRLGRIISHSIHRDKTNILTADCNIQPGDSGGGLFNLKGELVGLNSSAANIIGLNLFPAIDQFHIDKAALLDNQTLGDPKLAPSNKENYSVTLNNQVAAKIQQEFQRRIGIKYPPTIDFVMANRNEKNELHINIQQLAEHMKLDSVFLGKNQPISLGLDDPEITKSLPTLTNSNPTSIPIQNKDQKTLTRALPVTPNQLLAKASTLEKQTDLHITINKTNIPLKIIATHPAWDLALLETAKPHNFAVIDWSQTAPTPKQGALLLASDSKNRTIWGHTMDTPRPIKKQNSIGPFDNTLISKHRSPYPAIITHTLPLYATDTGAPIFNADKKFLGIHIARYTRTTSLLIPAQTLKTITKSLQKKATQTP